jgi:hypothetical protein
MAYMARSRNMTSCFVDRKHKQTWLRPARLATVSLAAVIASGDHMDAASRRNEPSVTAVESRTAGEPIMAIVSLRDQRITVYDKSGWILCNEMRDGAGSKHSAGRRGASARCSRILLGIMQTINLATGDTQP